jgi:hypothetical protein
MSAANRVAGAALAAVGALVLAWLSSAPMTASAAPQALVRLSWGARPERIETCRTNSDEALAKLSPQMRQRVTCEGASARYRLEVTRDGVPIASGVVRGGGLRHDRELYVFREIAVPAGRFALAVRFVRIDSAPATVEPPRPGDAAGDTLQGAISPERARRETDELHRRRAEAIPPVLELDTTLTLGARDVVLVTYIPDERTLRATRRLP